MSLLLFRQSRLSLLKKPAQFIPKLKSLRNFSNLTTTIENLTESFINLHTSTNLPWWVLVPLVTIGFRSVITLPLAVLNRKRIVKQHQLKPIIDSMYPILKFNLMNKSLKNQNTNNPLVQPKLTYEQVILISAKERRKRQKKLYRENNCQIWKNLSLPLLQIPLWVSLSLTIRQLSGWSSIFVQSSSANLEQSLVIEGLWWFKDLSVADPYGVLPIILGATALTNLELLGVYNNNKINNVTNRLTAYDSILNISRISIIFLMGIASQAPVILSLYWISSNLFSLIQNIVFQIIWPLRPNFNNNNDKVFKKSLIDDNMKSLVSLPNYVRKDYLQIQKSNNDKLDNLLDLELKHQQHK